MPQSFGEVYDLRTSSYYNSTDKWIIDGPFSWSEPTTFCGTTTWNEDNKLSGPGHQSHKLLTLAEEANHSDVRIAAKAIARFNVSADQLQGKISASLLTALSQEVGVVNNLPSPWFVAIGFHRSHLPLIVPARHLALYPEGSVPLPADQRARFAPDKMPMAATECAGGKVCHPGLSSMELWQQYTYNHSTSNSWEGWEGKIGSTMNPRWAAELKRFYYAALSHTDEMVGAVLAAVRARG